MKKYFLKNKIFYFIYKFLKIYKNKKPSTHFGEFGEDIFVSRLLKDINNGRYVDVGCYHPFKGSLTAKLYDNGWSGVNIDISKTTVDLFNISRKKDINLNIAVTSFDGNTFFYENSPINQQNSLIRTNDQQLKFKIKCFTLNSILEHNKIDSFDYLNIDVEGSEIEVIKGINFNKFNPRLITIENNDLLLEDYFKSEIYKILVDNKYTLVNKIGVTNFFVHNKIKNEISSLIKV